jgi:hypothetical protein
MAFVDGTKALFDELQTVTTLRRGDMRNAHSILVGKQKDDIFWETNIETI